MNKFIALLLTGALFSCNSKTDLFKEEKEIRNLLQQERKAHFERNVDLFVSEFADSMLFVNKGNVNAPSKETNKERMDKYFGSVQFIKWDDIAEPLIRFSDDGSLAYAIVQKEVIVTYPDSTGKAFFDTTHYAWASVYRKQKGVWKVEVNVSTNK
ncbi:MAG: hypothetical protein WBP16_05435 [Ferruginibacter sp.]